MVDQFAQAHFTTRRECLTEDVPFSAGAVHDADLDGVLIQARPQLQYPENPFFGSSRSRRADLPPTVKANQRTLHCTIGERFPLLRQDPSHSICEFLERRPMSAHHLDTQGTKHGFPDFIKRGLAGSTLGL